MSRLLPRFTEDHIETLDPLETEVARIEAEREAAIQAVQDGKHLQADPQDLRGIPCVARGVGGTSPHTNPATAVIRLDDHA